MNKTFTLEQAEQAKKLTIELWTYLAQNPSIERKKDLPETLLLTQEIKPLINHCPLCDIFLNSYLSWASPENCVGCPLFESENGCHKIDGPFESWLGADDEEARAESAQKIVRIVRTWKPVAREVQS